MRNNKNIYFLITFTFIFSFFYGCSFRNSPIYENNLPEANGYTVSVDYLNNVGTAAKIRIGKLINPEDASRGFSKLIYASERDGDMRIDEIKILAPKGSPLEKLVSLEKIRKIFKEFLKKHPRK